MKKSIITGILFLAIVSISAQEKGTKNTKPIKYTKGTNSSVIVEKEVKTEKTTPVSIRPTSSNSTNRAAVNSTNSKEVNTMRPEKVKVNTNRAAQNSKETMRPEKVKVNTNRAAQTSVETNRPEKVKVNTNRAAQTSVETNRPEKVKVNNERNSINKEEKPLKEEFNKLSVDYCKGWKEGYIKAWSKAHKGEKLEFVPNCETTGNCEGYKCGFKAGMKQAELNIR
jgi:hypothetical protein